LLDVLALGGDVALADVAGASPRARVALLFTQMALREAASPLGPQWVADTVLFPRATPRLVRSLLFVSAVWKAAREGPPVFFRTLVPTTSYLRYKGYRPEAGLVRAHATRLRRVLARAGIFASDARS
jgi:hypothetical protein